MALPTSTTVYLGKPRPSRLSRSAHLRAPPLIQALRSSAKELRSRWVSTSPLLHWPAGAKVYPPSKWSPSQKPSSSSSISKLIIGPSRSSWPALSLRSDVFCSPSYPLSQPNLLIIFYLLFCTPPPNYISTLNQDPARGGHPPGKNPPAENGSEAMDQA